MNEYPLNNPLSNDWKQPIIDEVGHVLTWRTQNNVPNMPIVVTEWGVWSFPAREASGDLALTVEYQAQYFRDHNIGSTWYTGIQYNQRAFAIFDTETGWNNTVSQAITQQPAPTTWPAMNQFVGSEFEDYNSKTWKRTNGQPHAQSDRVQFTDALSGNTSLKLTAPVTIYQRSFVGLVGAHVEVAENMETRLEKYLLHLIEGKTYKVSFKAKAVDGNGTMKFSMKENQSSASGSTVVNQTGETYHTSNPITITSTANTYSFTYTHNQATAGMCGLNLKLFQGL